MCSKYVAGEPTLKIPNDANQLQPLAKRRWNYCRKISVTTVDKRGYYYRVIWVADQTGQATLRAWGFGEVTEHSEYGLIQTVYSWHASASTTLADVYTLALTERGSKTISADFNTWVFSWSSQVMNVRGRVLFKTFALVRRTQQGWDFIYTFRARDLSRRCTWYPWVLFSSKELLHDDYTHSDQQVICMEITDKSSPKKYGVRRQYGFRYLRV